MYSWGEDTRGQLAQHLQDTAARGAVLEPRAAALVPAQVLQVACGEEHTLILSADGQVWTCGRNSVGQLGGKDRDPETPALVKGLVGVVGVACGRDHSLAVCQSGKVFAWGRDSEEQLGVKNSENHATKPREISIPVKPSVSKRVVQVACGNHHSLALTIGGEVYSWGLNSHGQLGLGSEVSRQPVPSQIQSLVGVPVTQIAAGGDFSLVLSLSGLVYCCGANGAGQLGLSRVDEKDRFNVCVVPTLRALSVSSISCGEAHTAVLTKVRVCYDTEDCWISHEHQGLSLHFAVVLQDGSVFTFGEGSHGQLGHNSTSNELRPRRVESLDGRATQIACGSYHTLVLMSNRQLLLFGTWSSGWAAEHSGMKPILQRPVSFNEHRGQIFKINRGKLQTWTTLDPSSEDAEEIKREITMMFLSSSSLVASFMRCSASESPSSGNPDPVCVDLNAARQIFQQLQENFWLNQLISVQSLVTNIFSASKSMISVDIFLILPECHLFHEDQHIFTFVLPLARAIVQLPDASIKHLREQWSSLKPGIVKKHIGMWKRALSFILLNGWLKKLNTSVKEVLQVLKHLYEVGVYTSLERAEDVLPENEFHIEVVCSSSAFLEEDAILWYRLKQNEDTVKTPVIFCRFPFVLNLQSKLFVFNCIVKMQKVNLTQCHYFPELVNGMGPLVDPTFNICVRRSKLVKDTFKQLKSTKPEIFAKALVVQFLGDLEQPFVNKKDFFLHIFESLFMPDFGMFMQNDSGSLLWFPVKPKMSRKKYFLFGVLCGLALYNNTTVYLPFPLALFKKLLNVKPTLKDLKELSPVVGKSLQYLLDYSDDDVENMDMCYTVVWNDVEVELDPHEVGKPVTSNNKHEFINMYVDYTLNKSAESLFVEFKRGFFTVCDVDVVQLFQAQELMELMVGNEDYDWDKLRQNTIYEGKYHARHPNIIRFWKVFEDLSPEHKKNFLLFVTGSARVPILGMDQIKMTVQSSPTLTRHHYPEAFTCYTILYLPVYKSKEMFQAKLIQAISYNRGFFKD
ncbi:putative E3 ubiquitin-protein ligase HERC6 [Arapaima gigas]